MRGDLGKTAWSLDLFNSAIPHLIIYLKKNASQPNMLHAESTLTLNVLYFLHYVCQFSLPAALRVFFFFRSYLDHELHEVGYFFIFLVSSKLTDPSLF